MKQYKAIDNWGKSIITVIAESEEQAKEAIARQLDRPGRRAFAEQWREGGERIICVGPKPYKI